MRILLIEDDPLLTQIIVNNLTSQHYAVDVAEDGVMGFEYAESATYDLIVMDVNLPRLDGIRLCQKLRQNRYTGSILLLTARGNSSDKVMGLDAGADDYVVKPCSVEELSARIRALLRRQSGSGNPVLEWGDLQLDPVTCQVSFQGQPLTLSPKEYGLLELFLRHPERIFSSSIILEHLWGFEEAPGEETVRSHIKRLRRKLKSVGIDDIIDTIYGMGYRLKSCELSQKTPDASPSPEALEEEARAAAIAIWEQFKPTILERLKALDQAVVALQSGVLPSQLHQAAIEAAHKLAGSLAMFGFPEGSRLGREIEDWLSQSQNNPQQQRDHAQLRSWVAALHQTLEQTPQAEERRIPVSTVPSSQNQERSFLVLVVDDDLGLIEQLKQEGVARGIQVEAATDPQQAREQIEQQVPNLVLLDLALPHTAQQGLAFLEELAMYSPNLPVIVFSMHDQMSDRRAVIQRGNYQFISKTAPLDQVWSMIQETLHLTPLVEIRVLAVDDDPLILSSLQQMLPRWGIQLLTLNQPQNLWKTLESITPDLVILDLQMPEINGLELCRIVRSDPIWSSLPILFLTSCREPEIVTEIYSAGADDYVAKPFTEPEIVTRIFNRLERNRLLRNLAENDYLTGLANRHRSTQELNRYLNLCQRNHRPFCLALLDLDHFKQMNDQYGHEIGDRILQRVAGILRQQFRDADVVARWGGEEFLIGMYGITKNKARERLQMTLDLLSQESFTAIAPESLHLTFSAGIVEASSDRLELQALYRAADAALYQAKAAGRNQIVIG
ncbi:MAG: response regulator [Leptolyngbyaceae cyanobacterium bins.59]|nr:response regulator [Leptolyngbyaceae cyanobacterium bins.59]